MRYAVISDIHGNLEAFRAVLDSLSKERVDAYLSVGDVVGYGADPVACVRQVESLKPKALIGGNHDLGALGTLGLDYFNEHAKDALVWTKQALGADDMEYIKSFRLLFSDRSITIVHGSLDAPADFHYIFDEDGAYPTVRLMKTPICFVGHTHVPGVFRFNGSEIERDNGPRVEMRDGYKYIVNAGSVGQPRDGDDRAAFAIYDNSDNTVEIKRVKYDVKTAQKKILAAALPEFLALRLAKGR